MTSLHRVGWTSQATSPSLVTMLAAMVELKLMGAGEIAQRLGGVSRQRVQQIVARRDFPEPATKLLTGKVWRSEDVEAWIREHRPELAKPEDPAAPES